VFEYRGKGDTPRWRARWDIALFVGSLLPSILWGIAFGDILHGIKMDAAHNYVGTFWDLLSPYALLAGLTTLTLFFTHGAVFAALKTTDDLRQRSRRLAWRSGTVTVVVTAGFMAWTEASRGGGPAAGASIALAVLAVAALAAGVIAARAGREGVAFTGTAVAIVAVTVALFTALYPDVLPSTISPADSLTTSNAASAGPTLAVMTVVAAIFLPFVLLYQAWTYWVFRKRISTAHIPPAEHGHSLPPSGGQPGKETPDNAASRPRGRRQTT
jgi:cytochrome bd ubiquinol oxidase subunit II